MKEEKTPPVVILCGGMGTRLREETEYKPKPMVEIGGRPIVWHIMKHYAQSGYKRFILALGYKGQYIREYFLNYRLFNSDFTVHLGDHDAVKIHNARDVDDWQITLVETGQNAMTGARVKRCSPYLEADRFLLTYGDGVSNVDIQAEMEFHLKHGKIGTVTGVRPSSRFGELVSMDGRVVEFSEKPQIQEGLINGGFFIFEKRFLSYLSSGEGCVLEKDPLERLAKDSELMVYRHDGFWQCMDTYRDYQMLNGLWDRGEAAWKTWG